MIQRTRWLLAWRVAFPLLVGGGAFALGGIGPGIFGLAMGVLCVVLAARIEKRKSQRQDRR
jgi:hypothetical protein